MLGLVLCNFIVPIPAIFMSRKVQGPAVAMVHTRVRPILSTGTHTLRDGEMFYQLFKPHHREL